VKSTCDLQRLRLAEADIYELKKRLNKAEAILEDFGFRRCDIPACDCGGYHAPTPIEDEDQ